MTDPNRKPGVFDRLMCAYTGFVLGVGLVALIAMCDPEALVATGAVNPWNIALMAASLCGCLAGAAYVVLHGTGKTP